jgi:hypothetical protein
MNIGKKILSAFVEVSEQGRPPSQPEVVPITIPPVNHYPGSDSGKFKSYFNKLFEEANIPGPDYYEFSKMIEAMHVIPDEKSRYMAAFAGLNVQGLDKTKLLSTAAQYLQLLDSDAASFSSTIDLALQEKVHSKQKEIEEAGNTIQQLSKEIAGLQNRIGVLQNEVKENEEKIQTNSNGYQAEMSKLKEKITNDIEKIKQHIN